jgi:hypothetical protein
MDKKAADRRLFCCSKWLFARTGAAAPKSFPLGGSWQKSLIFD